MTFDLFAEITRIHSALGYQQEGPVDITAELIAARDKYLAEVEPTREELIEVVAKHLAEKAEKDKARES